MTSATTKDAPRIGKWLDLGEIPFRFDGRDYIGREGDAAASALLANGIRLVGRSVKYRRRRGLLSAGADEPNALLTLGNGADRIPNIQATRLMLSPGMELFSQNRWPSLNWDATAVIRLGGSFFGAGFYYKTFIWPSWRSFEPIIRRLAGLGKAPERSDLPFAERKHLVCDVVVAGAGPAGLSLALALVRAGKSVIICESAPQCGGELSFETATINGLLSDEWVRQTVKSLTDAGAQIFTETDLVSARPGFAVAHHEPGGFPGNGETLLHIHAGNVIFATGASEYPIAYTNNDLPGCMLSSAAETFSARYGVLPGKNVVIFGNNDRIYKSAVRLLDRGAKIAAIVDSRISTDCADRAALVELGIACYLGSAILSAVGKKTVTAAVMSKHMEQSEGQIIPCDTILSSGGWTPSANLHEPLNDSLELATCGAAKGCLILEEVMADSDRLACRLLATKVVEIDRQIVVADPAPNLEDFWRSVSDQSSEKSQFVDFQNDVTVADLRQSVMEGFSHIEHAKRYTTLGFGTDQGRTSKTTGSAIISEFSSVESPSAVSRPRRPYRSVSLSALSGWRAGEFLRPTRSTPMTDIHKKQNAVMQPTGLWMRPHYFPQNGNSAATAGPVEAQRVRSVGGITDASTLSKIEIAGPEAVAFIDRMCLTKASKLPEGRGKYAMLLREDGMVLDDGLMVRIAPERFLLMTSTGHAEMLLSHLEYWHAMEWRSRAVTLTDVSDCWAVIVLAGPRSRSAMDSLFGRHAQDQISAMKHMDYIEIDWQGKSVRILRASFSGEWAYEIYARPDTAPKIWEALLNQGYQPYGLEALDILRVEKGYFTGAEINGQTTPDDLGFGALLKFNPSCVGADLQNRAGLKENNRQKITGLRSREPEKKIFAGAQITRECDNIPIGHITSAANSPSLNSHIGLALISSDMQIAGVKLMARDPLRSLECSIELAPVCQFDATGERMKS